MSFSKLATSFLALGLVLSVLSFGCGVVMQSSSVISQEGSLAAAAKYTFSKDSTPILSWNAATDSGLGVSDYEVAIGTTKGGTDILPYTSVGNVTTATVSGLNLKRDTVYYPSVRAVNALKQKGSAVTHLTGFRLCDTTSTFGGGDGTASNPYLICNVTQLNQVRNNLTSSFLLATSLSIPQSFSKISPQYSGTFDGDGNSISGYTDANGSDDNGFFSIVDNGVIKNLMMKDVNISNVNTGNRVGGLVGRLDNNAIIRNCGSSGVVKGALSVGGLVGIANSGSPSIIESFSSAEVTGGENVGGLIGRTNSSTTARITLSYATGSVSALSIGVAGVGGLIGFSIGAIISKSFATGNVAGGTGGLRGGLVGKSRNGTQISDSFATGSVTGTGDSAGGLYAWDGQSLTVSRAYSTGDVTKASNPLLVYYYPFGAITNNPPGATITWANGYFCSDCITTGITGGAGTGKTSSQLKDTVNYKTVYTGFDFDTVWNPPVPGVNGGYPTLRGINWP